MASPEAQNYIRRTMIVPISFPMPPFHRSLWGRCAAVLACALFTSADPAASLTRYTFEVPDRLDAAYDVALYVQFAGRVIVDARWGGGRILSFRLEGAGSPPVRLLRAGPSPQRIEAAIPEGSSSIGAPWRLVIRALPGRGASQVSLSVELPQGPTRTESTPVAHAESEPAAETTPLEPWARSVSPKAGGFPQLVPLFQSVERFRAAIVGASGEFVSDPCSWHSDFLHRVATLRDTLAASAVGPTAADANCMTRMASAVRRVDEIRASVDPLFAGPVPTDARERIVWRARRGDRIRPLEGDLDSILSESRKDVCPALRDDVWPSRFAACLIACERYFEERVRMGDDAANADLAKSEWDRYLQAAQVLEILASLSAPPAAPAE